MPLHLMLLAGEVSGDRLGGRLIPALRAKHAGEIRLTGVGGPAMAAAGLDSLFPMEDLSVMGFAEVVPRLPLLRRRLAEVVEAAIADPPDLLLTIDSPGFTLRVARRLAGRGYPCVHYVAPQIWAWRPGRAAKYAHFLDHILALLPFEPPYFEKVGLPSTFVGHPVVEYGPTGSERADLDVGSGHVLLLPGSRRGEVARHMPVLRKTSIGLVGQGAATRFSVLTVEATDADIREAIASWPVPVAAVDTAGKAAAMADASLALSASGTATLELAIAGIPSIVIYRANALSAALARWLIRVPYVALPNILLGEGVLPELLQGDCNPARLIAEASRLLRDPQARRRQRARLGEVAALLGAGGEPPSSRAAAAVLELAGRRATAPGSASREREHGRS